MKDQNQQCIRADVRASGATKFLITSRNISERCVQKTLFRHNKGFSYAGAERTGYFPVNCSLSRVFTCNCLAETQATQMLTLICFWCGLLVHFSITFDVTALSLQH